MVNYKLVEVIIDITRLAKMIFDIVVQYYSLFNFIISNYEAIIISKFWLLLCYLLSTKR